MVSIMKKGFTLIEIIICIIFVSIICTLFTFISININKTDKNIDDITKKILDAATVYVNVAKDDEGNNFLHEVVSGNLGVQIPLTVLVNEGYIEKSITQELYELKGVKKTDNESYYVLFVNGNSENYCDKTEITTIASWMSEDSPIYLCNDYNKLNSSIDSSKEDSNNFIKYLINKNYIDKIDLGWDDRLLYNCVNLSVPNDYSSPSYSGLDGNYYGGGINFSDITINNVACVPKHNGLFNKIDNLTYYFYRGMVDDNYVIFSKGEGVPSSFTDNYLWRIINFDETTNYIRLIKETSTIYDIESQSDEIIKKYIDKTGNISNIIPDNQNGFTYLYVSEPREAGIDYSNKMSYNFYHRGEVGYYTSYISSFLLQDDFNSTKLSENTQGLCITPTYGVHSKCTTNIRPVLTIDARKIKFEGNGTRRNPYIIKPNN